LKDTAYNILTKTSCYHCGDEVISKQFKLAEKEFCCEGCKQVYSLLNEAGMCDYYNLSEQPGIKLNNVQESKFDYLNDEQISNKLLCFKDEKLSKVVFYVPVIHCSSCVWLLENLHLINPNIVQGRVQYMKKEVSVLFQHQEISLREVVILLAKLGYEPSISLANEEEQKVKTNKKIYYQLGVAGFCFGNIMLLSLPDYFDFTGRFHQEMGSWIGFLMLILSLPVLIYSDLDYLKSAYQAYKYKMMNLDVPISLGIMALFGVSVFEIVSHTGAGYLDSFAGLIFFLLLGKAFQQKTFDTLSFERDYKSYFPISVTVLEETGNETTVPVSKLATGDRILVRNAELIPADAILLKGRALIDYSFVTGESVPVEKVLGEMVYAGGRQVGEHIELEVMKAVSQSYLTGLWNNEVFTKNKESRLTSLVNSNSKRFTIIILSIATLAAIYWIWMGQMGVGVKVFASVLIVACPCALALSTPFTLGNALRALGKRNLYLKNAAVVEDLAAVDTIVFDKTGTLSDTSKSKAVWYGNILSEKEMMLVKSVMRASTHPLSRNIFQTLAGEVTEIEEVTEYAGKGLLAKVGGQIIKIGSAAFVKGEKMFTGQTVVFVSIDEVVKGYFAMNHVYRTGLENLAKELVGKYNLVVLSGDNEREKESLEAIFGKNVPMYFNQSPNDKLQYIANLKSEGHKVMMLGDGLNDAGALKMSSVGVSVTENVASFSPACDAILDAKEFSRLGNFLQMSKISVRIIKACYAISLLYNIVGLTVTVQGKLSPVFTAIVMPLSSITIMLFTTLSVGYFAGRVLKVWG